MVGSLLCDQGDDVKLSIGWIEVDGKSGVAVEELAAEGGDVSSSRGRGVELMDLLQVG